MKDILKVTSIVTVVLTSIFATAWAAREVAAHYDERKYQFEWELQQRTIAGLLNSVERMIEMVKQ